MPKYVLTYFDAPGRAETARHMFVQSGVEFEDNRLSKEQWMAQKEKAPLKQLPIMDVEGMGTMCQSPAIERYVAKVCGYMGKDEEEACTIDQLHTTAGELGLQVIPYFFGEISQDEEKKEALRKSLINEKLPRMFSYFNRQLEAHCDGEKFLMGEKLCLADFLLANVLKFLRGIDKEGTLASTFPKVFALGDRVHALPAIAAYAEKHRKQ